MEFNALLNGYLFDSVNNAVRNFNNIFKEILSF